MVTGKYHSSGSSSQEKQAQRFAMEPQDQTAIIGSRVTLPCRVIDKTGLIQWTKDDFGLGVHRNLSGFDRYSMVGSDEEGDFSLDISPIMLDDDARYQCQVSPGADGKHRYHSHRHLPFLPLKRAIDNLFVSLFFNLKEHLQSVPVMRKLRSLFRQMIRKLSKAIQALITWWRPRTEKSSWSVYHRVASRQLRWAQKKRKRTDFLTPILQSPIIINLISNSFILRVYEWNATRFLSGSPRKEK